MPIANHCFGAAIAKSRRQQQRDSGDHKLRPRSWTHRRRWARRL